MTYNIEKGKLQKAGKEAFPFTNGKTFEASNYANKSVLKILKGNMKKKKKNPVVYCIT